MKQISNWFNSLVVKQMLNSKKFWYMVSSVVVPAIVTYLGVDDVTARELYHAILVLIVGQGIADVAKK